MQRQAKEDEMFVVTIDNVAPELPNPSLADVISKDPFAIERASLPNEPSAKTAATLSQLKFHNIPIKITNGIKKPKYVEDSYSLETLAKIYQETTVNAIPSVLVFANANLPGGERLFGNAQEENILKNSNLAFGMPNRYFQNDIWKQYQGIYAVLCRTNKDNLPFWAIIMAAPNLNSKTMNFKVDKETIVTPSDAELFGINNFRPDLSSRPRSYMLHVLGEVVMQFYMTKLLGSEHFVTGLFGAGVFNANPEYYAAALKFVSQLTMFANIKVVCALGPNKEAISGRKVADIYDEPKAELLLLAKELYVANFAPYEEYNKQDALNRICNKVCQFYQERLPAEVAALRAPKQEPNIVAAKKEGLFKIVVKALFLPEPLEKPTNKP